MNGARPTHHRSGPPRVVEGSSVVDGPGRNEEDLGRRGGQVMSKATGRW